MFAATGIGGVVYGARAWMPELASRHGAGIDAMLTYLLISAFRSGILLCSSCRSRWSRLSGRSPSGGFARCHIIASLKSRR
jgi:hypothetical protein